MNPWELLAEQTKQNKPAVPRPKTKKTRLAVGDVVFGWTLLEYWPGAGRHEMGKWKCRCTCGVERKVQANNLMRGASKNCGHSRYEREFK